MTVLLTGLTGEVGSTLAPILQSKNIVFCLVRDGKSRSIDGKINGIPSTQIIEGDITNKDFCDIGTDELKLLKNLNIQKIVHSAASVKFDEHLSDEIWTTNFVGTANVLALAKELNVEEFHYLSTAYAPRGRNPYEKSKFAAENSVKESGLAHSIYRLSIVIGNSKTGVTNGFNGYYGFFVGPHRIAERIRRKEGKSGKVHLPIYINCSFDSTLNLVPVDWAVDMLVPLLNSPCQNETYHITHSDPPKTHWVMEQGFETLGISDVVYYDYKKEQPDQKDKRLRLIQKAVNKELERYHPYVTEDDKFCHRSLELALNSSYSEPPQITTQLLSMLLQYAVENNFKK